MAQFIAAIGLVFVFEGLIYAIAPGRMKQVMKMAGHLPEDILRITGLVAIAAGVLIVWMARSLSSG